MALIFAFMHLYTFVCLFVFCLLLLSIPFLLFSDLVLINLLNGPRYRLVLALCAFFNRGGTEATNFSKILCSMFMFYVILCTRLILWFLNNLWFDGLRARVNRRQTEHCFKP